MNLLETMALDADIALCGELPKIPWRAPALATL